MNITIFNGMILAMEEMGGQFIKSDNTHVFFKIKKDSEIDDLEKLLRMKEAFKDLFGLSIKIKKI